MSYHHKMICENSISRSSGNDVLDIVHEQNDDDDASDLVKFHVRLSMLGGHSILVRGSR